MTFHALGQTEKKTTIRYLRRTIKYARDDIVDNIVFANVKEVFKTIEADEVRADHYSKVSNQLMVDVLEKEIDSMPEYQIVIRFAQEANSF